jgi:hypothetical protein
MVYIPAMFSPTFTQEAHMKKLLVVTAILLFSVAPAMASNFYGKGTLGLFSPSESGLDNSVALYAAGGMNLKEQFNAPISAEVGIGYMAPSARYVDVTIVPVTMTVLYELPFNVPQLAFNVGGGLGLYFWDAENDSSGWNDDGVELGLHVQTGAEFKLNPAVSLIGEVKYSVADAGGVFDGDLGGLSANAGVKLNF